MKFALLTRPGNWQFLKVISTKLILKYAQIVALAPMFARLKQFILSKREINRFVKRAAVL
jgi:hypothetical protein